MAASFGKDLLEFLYNVDEMHAHLQKAPRHAGCQFPHFHTCTSPDGQLLLSYSSKRGDLLAPVTEGVLIELAPRVYKQRLSMTRQPVALDGYAVTWAIRIEAMPGATADGGAGGSEPAHVIGAGPSSDAAALRAQQDKRAASTWHEALAGSLQEPERASGQVPFLSRAFPALSAKLSGAMVSGSGWNGHGRSGAAEGASGGRKAKAMVTPEPPAGDPEGTEDTPVLAVEHAKPTDQERFEAAVSAAATQGSVGSVMSWVIAHHAVPPPRLTWYAAFAEPAAEEQFRRDMLRKAIVPRAIAVCAVLGVASALAMGVLWAHDGQVHAAGSGGPALFALLALCGSSAALLALLGVAKLPDVPLAVAEAALVCLLGLLSVGCVILVPQAEHYNSNHSHEHGSGNNGSSAEHSMHDVPSSQPLLQLALVLSCALVLCIGCVTSLPPRPFGLAVTVDIVFGALFVVAQPRCAPSDGGAVRCEAASTELLLTFLLLALLHVFATLHVRHCACVERHRYHCARIIIDGMPEWRNVKQQELETYLRASQAETAIAARAKLIRVVLHVRAARASQGRALREPRVPAAR